MLSHAAHARGTSTARASLLPFSRASNDAALSSLAHEFVERLGLPLAHVRIVEGTGCAGLEGERRFRYAWWTHGVEEMRAALQRAKINSFLQAAARAQTGHFTRAWQRAEQESHSHTWRVHLRRLTEHAAETDKEYLRLAFRAAQQIWSRSARWQAVMPETCRNPFAPLRELLAAGAWPLGCADGALWLFKWNAHPHNAPEFAPAWRKVPMRSRPGYIFLSAQFRDAALTALWRAALHACGWKTVHGPASEDVDAPEVQLGRQIREARAVVGLIEEIDEDFKLPWWMFQELDYARACRRPVFLISRKCAASAFETRDHRFAYASSDCAVAQADLELQFWIETNAPRIWRT